MLQRTDEMGAHPALFTEEQIDYAAKNLMTWQAYHRSGQKHPTYRESAVPISESGAPDESAMTVSTGIKRNVTFVYQCSVFRILKSIYRGPVGVWGYRGLEVWGYRGLGVLGFRGLGVWGYRGLGVWGFRGLGV